jgi:putative membrane protein
MTTPSEPIVATEALTPDHRLHPASPLFVLLLSLRRFALPILIVLFTGRGDRTEFLSLIAVALLAVHSIARYFTYRYRIERDGVVIKSGIFQKSVRHIPFDRIQNVSLRQSVLHRMFGVAEVELESAGAGDPEGQMRVLSLAAAHDLEATVRIRERAAHAADGDAADVPARRLLALDMDELFRLGIVSNRGLVLIAAALGVFTQLDSEVMTGLMTRWTQALFGWSQTLHLSAAGIVLGVITLGMVGLALLYVLSAALAIMRYYGFVLTDDGKRLRVERGLLTRVRGALLRRRIQAYSVRESLFHRWLGRRSLRVDSAAMPRDEERSLSELAPIAAPSQLDALIADLLAPGATWPLESWRALHPRAWRRVFFRPAIYALIATGFAVLAFDAVGFLTLLLLPVVYLRARVWARHAAYGKAGGLIAVREGWLDRGWRFAEVRKLQVLELTQSPFDRRHGMATLHMDTAGATLGALPLRIRFLPEADAHALYARLASEMRG